MRPVRVALIGTGSPHSRAYLRTLLLSELVGDVLLCDPDGAASDQLVSEFPGKISRVYGDIDELLQAEEILFAICHLRNDLNAEACLRVIASGRHVLSEKPVGKTSTEVAAVVDAARRAGVKFGVSYINRRNPATREARRIVSAGEIGKVTSVETRIVVSQPRFRDPSLWLFKSEYSGGGILSWLGCHYIDLMSYVTGDEIVAVTAIADTLSGENIDVEDVISASFRFRGGAIGSIQAGYQIALSKPGYHGGRYDTRLAVRGTEGVVEWVPHGGSPALLVESTLPEWSVSPSRTIRFELAASEAYGGACGLEFVNDFINDCVSQCEPLATGEDALRLALVVEAAYESNRTGRRIDIG